MTENQADLNTQDATVILDSSQFQEILLSWKKQIAAAIRAGEPWALVGIKRRGSVLARRLHDELKKDFPDLDFGELDISLYRDDYHLQHSQPQVLGTQIDFVVDGCRILVIDDVLYTGRTVRAALDLILDFGRPRRVLLGVLVDRGHRELPIAADFVGKKIDTEREDRVQVHLSEMGQSDSVLLIRA